MAHRLPVQLQRLSNDELGGVLQAVAAIEDAGLTRCDDLGRLVTALQALQKVGFDSCDNFGGLREHLHMHINGSDRANEGTLRPELRNALTALDDRLVAVLAKGAIRFVRSSWFLMQPSEFRIMRRRELEAVEHGDTSNSPLLTPQEAVVAIRQGNRNVGVLSYPWLSPSDPDPAGRRVEVLRRTLEERSYLTAFFWDFASLYQHPPGGRRTTDEEISFQQALDVMGDLYASAIGTTVLQLKEIPPRPCEFDGALCMFGLAQGVNDSDIKVSLRRFGFIESCEIGGRQEAIVRFTTHEAALRAMRAPRGIDGICDRIDTLYNERSYDGRTGEAGYDDDYGRGWCRFEAVVSGEVIMRLKGYPKMRTALELLPPKLLALHSDSLPIELPIEQLHSSVGEAIECIQHATFTGSSDKQKVPLLYKEYVERIAQVLEKTLGSLALVAANDAGPQRSLPLPDVPTPAPVPLCLQANQFVIMLLDRNGRCEGGNGFAQVGKVSETGKHVTLLAGTVPLSMDDCTQAVLPWQQFSRGYDKMMHVIDDCRRRLFAKVPAEFKDEASVTALSQEIDNLLCECSSCSDPSLIERASDFRKRFENAKVKERIFYGEEVAGLRDLRCLREVSRAFGLRELAGEIIRMATDHLVLALKTSSALGMCGYAAGQRVSVVQKDGWQDAQVAQADEYCNQSAVFLDDMQGTSTQFRQPFSVSQNRLILHPWNHAPCELPCRDFEAMCSWWVQDLRRQHTQMPDALTGKPLDTMQQCVGIQMSSAKKLPHGPTKLKDVRDLMEWMLMLCASRQEGENMETSGQVLLTAPPAAGKTTLISQSVIVALDSQICRPNLLPIVIKVQFLQRMLISHRNTFGLAWNWIDAYLQITHGSTSPLYRALRQAMVARHAIILLDGLDEGGTSRAEIERHVTEVLAYQGHFMLITSRPAGIVEANFGHFHRLRMAPLTSEQQREALELRLGMELAEGLLPYLNRLPVDKKGQQATANPLILSMLASVFELRHGIAMPSTIAELYEIASEAMMARGSAGSNELRRLMQATFFEAHVSQRRLIEDRHLFEAALGLEQPEVLASFRRRAAAAPFENMPLSSQELKLWDYVEVRNGEHCGKRGVINQIYDSDSCSVVFADGTQSGWMTKVRTSGLTETAFLQEAMKMIEGEVRDACAMLSEPLQNVLDELRRRVAHDDLPLLRLLQGEPLQLQASHLTFQEFFTARTLCESGCHPDARSLSGTPPWQWPAWWNTTIEFGAGMGKAFGRGLLLAAGVKGDELDLSGQLAGDESTAIAAVVQCAITLVSLDISNNRLSNEGSLKLGRSLGSNGSLKELVLKNCHLEIRGARELAKGLEINNTLRKLVLIANQLKDIGAFAIGQSLKSNQSLEDLDISRCSIGSEGGIAIAQGLEINTGLQKIVLSLNPLGDKGAIAICDSLIKNNTLKAVHLRSVGLHTKGNWVHMLSGNASLTYLDLAFNNIEPSAQEAFKDVKCNVELTPGNDEKSPTNARKRRPEL